MQCNRCDVVCSGSGRRGGRAAGLIPTAPKTKIKDHTSHNIQRCYLDKPQGGGCQQDNTESNFPVRPPAPSPATRWLRAVVGSNSIDVMSWSRGESGTKRSNAPNPVGRSTAELEADLLAPVGESLHRIEFFIFEQVNLLFFSVVFKFTSKMRLFLTTFIFIALLCQVAAVDRSKFKNCAQSSFCRQCAYFRRQRNFKPTISPYSILPQSVSVSGSGFHAEIQCGKGRSLLKMTLQNLQVGAVRLIIDEKEPLRERFRPLQALNGEPVTSDFISTEIGSDMAVLKVAANKEVVVMFKPLRLDMFVDKNLVMSFNGDGRFNFETFKEKPKELEDNAEPKPLTLFNRLFDYVQTSVLKWLKPLQSEQNPADEASENKKYEQNQGVAYDRDGNPINDAEHPLEEGGGVEQNAHEEEEDTDGLWTEHFHTFTDSKPYGPSSVAADISFIGFRHVFGLPEHADSLVLRDTNQTDPYRLYNLDVFQYEVDSPMALYGAAPYMIAHSAKATVGAFWLNSAEGWFDVSYEPDDSSLLKNLFSRFFANDKLPVAKTHWMFETGSVDIFFLFGPKPDDIFRQYSTLTGVNPLPPYFALGKHVSRWNFIDMNDVRQTDAGYDLHDIPYDVIWLDIEHTYGKRYFTWDPIKFSNPAEMIRNISAKGRKMVAVVDPHIKKDENWDLYQEALEKDYYVKDVNNRVYEGWCWPGAAVYLDFLNPEVRKWYANKYQFSEYKGSTEDLYVWNDMNEPSVFSGPEVSMPRDNIHFGGLEHREVHNVYGLFHHMSTFDGLYQRSNGKKRPFVLTRSFFIGSQRYANVWTGDNAAQWSHLRISNPMVLSLGIAGFPFTGADIGGFFGNPDEELIVRWYQVGIFHSFFRVHSELNTRRREPWFFSEQTKALLRDIVRLRYSLLPYWYTGCYEHTKNGWPIVRPMWTEFPTDTALFNEEKQFMIGRCLMARPVTEPGESSVHVYLPDEKSEWYDWFTHIPIVGPGVVQVATPLEKIPLFVRGGCIVPIKERMRRSSGLSHQDPFTLIMALNKDGTFANGTLYLDDGDSYEYKNGQYLYQYFVYSGDKKSGSLMSTTMHPNANYNTNAWIEKIVILGLQFYPTDVHVFRADYVPKKLNFVFDNQKMMLTIRKPEVPYLFLACNIATVILKWRNGLSSLVMRKSENIDCIMSVVLEKCQKIFIHRDYSSGMAVRFQTKLPPELVGRVR
ncbi:Neutral alpha-glucosidase AB [Trichinella spiralis]|uniref:Glucosidase II subunit alpha n=1 Tax=Trichinella spiralis TaxID=6334 RepID=A0A0V1BP92_TRISP|nr:Neutral alpha-glucosidase AB [Trichinella spiralis]